ncbi:MAG TPA: S41 family peptidase [Streptosporangiaceae bacterium]|nr:S41 family peptidase [Streptosporangiaceae bacterium]
MMRYPGSRWAARAGLCCLAATAVTAAAIGAAGASGAAQAARTPPGCSQHQQQRAPGPTTVTTIGQAYYCIFAHYYSGPVLDDRVLLSGAFGGLTQELNRLGTDQPDATMPALTGSRDSDWAAFAAVYSRVISKVPPRDVQQVAAATMTGMVAALNDNHAHWSYPSPQPPGATPSDIYGVGINTLPAPGLVKYAPGKTLPPAVVMSVDSGSPATRAGVRTGDIIVSVNGAPPFTDGYLSPGVFALLYQSYPQQQPVRITLRWPVTGDTRTVTITPAVYPALVPPVTAKLLDGAIGYVQLPGFNPGSASQVLAAVTGLEKTATLRGLILDLGGGGGSRAEVAQLLGAFEHGTAYGYDCTVTGQCTADYPDASTPLLHLPLAVLADRDCVSACEEFSGAVKDLHLGTLIGIRTNGIVSGTPLGWVLDDGSALGLPAKHYVSADHELITGIGVAPDYYIPLTAWDLATGHDPDIAKALALFKA